MHLTTFEKEISNVILQRGKDYFSDGAVIDLQIMDNGQCFAIVEGNDDYEVEIRLGRDGEILEYSCNCPYDGDICKHIVAVLYSIKDKSPGVRVNKKVSKKEPWKNILDNLPEDELKSFVTQYAARNIDFRNRLTLEYPMYDNTGDKDKYKKIIRNVFKRASDKHGFIDYHSAGIVMQQVFELLSIAERLLNNDNYKEAFRIVTAVAPECIKAIQAMDDSDGGCGDAITHAFELTGNILNRVHDASFKDEVFNWLVEQAKNDDYDDYGCAGELYPLLIDAVDSDKKAAIVEAFLDNRLKYADKKDGWSREYQTKTFLLLKTDLYSKTNQPGKAERIIQENLHIADFRRTIVKKELAEKKFEKAVELIHEGIRIAQKEGYRGIENDWKEMLLEVYQASGNIKELRKTALDLYYSAHDSMKFYRIYKNTFTPEEWPAVLQGIINRHVREQDKTRRLFPVVHESLANVYIEEKMWQPLLNLLQKSLGIHSLLRYGDYLVNDYAQDMITLYLKAIEVEAQRASNRNDYMKIVFYILKMAKIKNGKEPARLLTESLINTYPRRPAMVDELSKALNHKALN
ncbi:MAG: SWIM zinc finger family protein [Bacteroidales bacterium]|nr:SWIM zinc finger family protein [Bacteroidales bacterium]